MMTLRPGDANEVVEAYKLILKHKHGPSSLVLTRQAVPTLDRTKYAPASGVGRGAYVLADAAGGKPDVILMASGSELSLCVDAYEKLKAEGLKARSEERRVGKECRCRGWRDDCKQKSSRRK